MNNIEADICRLIGFQLRHNINKIIMLIFVSALIIKNKSVLWYDLFG